VGGGGKGKAERGGPSGNKGEHGVEMIRRGCPRREIRKVGLAFGDG